MLAVATALTANGTNLTKTEQMNHFIDSLMSQMTVEEKIGQLNLQDGGDIQTGSSELSPVEKRVAAGEIGAILNLKGLDKIDRIQHTAVEKSRLGIPLIIGLDVIHGYVTTFPIPLALACSWNPEAVEEAMRISASEATADGLNWTFSPMVDIALDPRWGRIAEGNGEDPFLGSEMARAYVRGFQGDFDEDGILSDSTRMIACLKHYALYGAAESGRDYNTVDMSRHRMYNQYLPPYKAAVEEGVGTVMTSFNTAEGIPATAHKWLCDTVLRQQWGFDGMVVSDYGSIGEIERHGVAPVNEGAVMALEAGTDMDMCSNAYPRYLKEALEAGKIDTALIDASCRRVLETKYRLGLFKNPYRFTKPDRRKAEIFSDANRQAAREIAAQTFVLLENKNDILPLKPQGTIALIGPLADTRNNISGTWSFGQRPELYTTLREAFEKELNGKATLLYAQGSNIYGDEVTQQGAIYDKPLKRGDDNQLMLEAIETAKKADVIICAMGESAEMSGESASRADLTMPDVQAELLRKLKTLGKPIVLLHFSGRPTLMNWEAENLDAILNVWFGGCEAGAAIADVVFGRIAPSGKLVTTIPQSMGQIPLYYNHLSTGRSVPDTADRFMQYQSNYVDVRNGPLYPFGYGKSYTTFSYGTPTLSSSELRPDGKVTLNLEVTNTGNRDATEIVQLYIHDIFASTARPIKELKGFKRINIPAGKTEKVQFDIDPSMLGFYNSELKYVTEPGDFEIMVGPDSRDLQTLRLKYIE